MAGKKSDDLMITKVPFTLKAGFPLVVMSISGGKDSMAMWLQLWRAKIPNLVGVYYLSSWDWPCGLTAIKKIEELTGVKCYVIDDREWFNNKIIERGWPSWRVRWCTGHKRDIIKRFFNSLKRGQPGTDLLNAIGVNAGEGDRITKDWVSRERAYLPLVESGIDGKRALRICSRAGLDWGGHYLRRSRLSCWCCPYQKLEDLRELYAYNTEYWNELVRLDTLAPAGRKFQWSRKFLPELGERFKKELEAGII